MLQDWEIGLSSYHIQRAQKTPHGVTHLKTNEKAQIRSLEAVEKC